MLARQNSIEEVRPCEIIRIIAPEMAHWVWIIVAATTSPMWLTEEYAINDFRSTWRRQMALVISAPHRARVIKG